MDLQVVKRDGVKEPFDQEKIIAVTVAAGLDRDKAKAIAAGILDWLEKSGLHEITSIQLRDMVIGKLQNIDESAAKMYVWYQMTKLKNS